MQLRSGLYFSARELGATVWEHATAGTDVDALVVALSNSTGQSPEVVRTAVLSFLKDAERYQLGVLDPAPGEPAPAAPWPSQWKAPVLEAFSDMQDLLLLDPIHDVSDEAGWPQQRAV